MSSDAIIKRVLNAQYQANQNIVDSQKDGLSIVQAQAKWPRPIDVINRVFRSARLAVEIKLDNGILRASRGNVVYGIEQMSDGERAALLFVGAVLVQPYGKWIAVDDPEKHLNPSISGPLISSTVVARKDLGFLFATHDLQLIEWLKPSTIIHVLDSTVIHQSPEVRTFNINKIDADSDIGENLRYSIIGSRKALLLVEGTTSSDDKLLYGLIYPGWNIVARGGWEAVSSDVRALASSNQYHWIRVAGLIDTDGRSQSEINKLAALDIFSIPGCTIENLFCNEVVLRNAVSALHAMKGGLDADQAINQIRLKVAQAFEDNKNEIIFRRVNWPVNRLLSENKTSVKSISGGQRKVSEIDINPVLTRIEAEFDSIVGSGDVFKMLRLLPIKQTKVPEVFAQGAGFADFSEYQSVVFRQMQTETEYGQAMIKEYRSIMPKLTTI